MPIMSRININLSAWDTLNTIPWNSNLYKALNEHPSMARIQETPRGQKTITIPKNLATALGLKKGDRISFRVNKQGNLELVKE